MARRASWAAKWALIAVLALALAVIAAQLKPAAPAARPGSETEAGAGTASFVKAGVERVYDGDTIEASGVGKVRLIGIDAMDGYNLERALSQARSFGMSAEQVKAWADRATEYARRRLRGRRVTLCYGPERTDAYGRTLAYVQVPGAAGEEDFNLQMLRAGMAVAYRDFPHPRLEAYVAAEKEAQAARAGLWKDATVRP